MLVIYDLAIDKKIIRALIFESKSYKMNFQRGLIIIDAFGNFNPRCLFSEWSLKMMKSR